jgi:hypothetical protein
MQKRTLKIAAAAAFGLCLTASAGYAAPAAALADAKLPTMAQTSGNPVIAVRWGGFHGGAVGFGRGYGYRGAGFGRGYGYRGAGFGRGFGYRGWGVRAIGFGRGYGYRRYGWRGGYYGGWGWPLGIGLGIGAVGYGYGWGGGYPVAYTTSYSPCGCW